MRVMLAVALAALWPLAAAAQEPYRGPFTAAEETAEGPLYVTPIYHGSLMFEFGGLVVHVDPYSRGDYEGLPPADLILITHHHRDHLDIPLIERLSKPGTVVVGTEICARQLPGIRIIRNGESGTFAGVAVEAVPAYNLVRERSPGLKYHPRGEGNGYLIDFGGLRVYVAGDTECVPEMDQLGPVDIAFLPCNLPYTMPAEEAAACARRIRPRILYPYHQGDTDPNRLAELLADEPEIEVRALPLN